jgi:elongation factor G
VQVEGFTDRPGGMKAVAANVPLAAMFNYVSNLRSMTKGRGSYQMKLADYQQVPPNIQEEIISAQKVTA